MRSLLAAIALFCFAGGAQPADVAIVTSVQGQVSRAGDDARLRLKAFDRIRDGEFLLLESDARLRLLFFENGRYERWSGASRLEIAAQGSRPESAVVEEVRSLPLTTASQIARMPDPSKPSQVTGRTRSIPTLDALASLDERYRDLLASRSDADDLSAEIFLLSALYELRQFERVERVVSELQQSRPKNPEAMLLVALYRKALRNARESGK